MPTLELEGKVAWVTGASGDIGAAIVEEFADWGATVVPTDVRDSGRDWEHERSCDVRSSEDIADVVRYCEEAAGGLDILVNCAAIASMQPLDDISSNDWEQLLSVNLTGAFQCSQAAAASMASRSVAGAIVNIASVQGAVARGETVSYATSKAGMRGLTVSMAVALGPSGIRVNAVAPGTIATSLNAVRWKQPDVRQAIEHVTPLGRLGKPEDVAVVTAFLASPRASFVTGSILAVHGGRTLID